MSTQSEDGEAVKGDARKEFAEALRDARELREAGRWTQAQLARAVRASSSTISRIESSNFPIPFGLAELFDQVFETDGKFKRLFEKVRSDEYPERAQQRMRLEPQALAISEWSQSAVPGLLQTPSYARTLFRKSNPRATESEIRDLVRARMARQEIFRQCSPPDFSVVLCESVVKRNVGGPDVMREQLGVLLSQGRRPTTRIQILPLAAECHGLVAGALSILTPPSGPVVVYTEGISVAALMDDPGAVRKLSRFYDEVTASALSGGDSVELIHEAMEAL